MEDIDSGNRRAGASRLAGLKIQQSMPHKPYVCVRSLACNATRQHTKIAGSVDVGAVGALAVVKLLCTTCTCSPTKFDFLVLHFCATLGFATDPEQRCGYADLTWARSTFHAVEPKALVHWRLLDQSQGLQEHR